MSPHLKIHCFCATPLIVILTLVASVTGNADEGCFAERGRIQMVNITKIAVSGHLVTSLQRGSWDTRPTVRVSVVRPHGPIEVGTWNPVWNVADIGLVASTAFVAADGGLFALDLSDPSNPTELSFIDLIDSEHLAVDGDRAYIATTGVSGNGWFDVIDLSDPAVMERRGSLYWARPDPSKTAIDAAGEIAVIADVLGLLIIDVSNPWLPTEQGRWPREGVRDVALVGELAAVAITSWVDPEDVGMTLVDLSQPSSPTPVGAWQAPSAVLSVAEHGGGVVVGTETDGLFLLDIEDPANPTVVDHWREPGVRVQNLATAWPTIATSSFDIGLQILGLHRSCIPPRHPSDRLAP